MSDPQKTTSEKSRTWLAFGTMGFAAIAILILAIVAICMQPKETMTVFNIVLPVMATWVGTILAFYFGRENFESANKQVRDMIDKISPEQRAQSSVKSIMRGLLNMTYFKIENGKKTSNYKLSDLNKKFSGNIARLPIVDKDNKPLYLIHKSRIDNYIQSDAGTDKDTLESFIKKQESEGYYYGIDKGFVIVTEETSLGAAKQKMKNITSCQDIFVTKTGTENEPLIGWISNTRLEKFFQ